MVTRGLSAKFKASVASFPVRDSRGHEVDFVVDLVSRRIPIEAKSGLTVAGDAFDGLDRYLDLSRDPAGLLVYGGDEARPCGRHHLMPWWALS